MTTKDFMKKIIIDLEDKEEYKIGLLERYLNKNNFDYSIKGD